MWPMGRRAAAGWTPERRPRVIRAEAGIRCVRFHRPAGTLDSRLRGNDGRKTKAARRRLSFLKQRTAYLLAAEAAGEAAGAGAEAAAAAAAAAAPEAASEAAAAGAEAAAAGASAGAGAGAGAGAAAGAGAGAGAGASDLLQAARATVAIRDARTRDFFISDPLGSERIPEIAAPPNGLRRLNRQGLELFLLSRKL
jgi:hypothetical protein